METLLTSQGPGGRQFSQGRRAVLVTLILLGPRQPLSPLLLAFLGYKLLFPRRTQLFAQLEVQVFQILVEEFPPSLTPAHFGPSFGPSLSITLKMLPEDVHLCVSYEV